MTKTTFQQQIDGTARGLGPTIFRAVARTISVPYSGAVRFRNALYDVGVFRSRRVERLTISVGNLTLGGVGKTPFIGWLTDFFLKSGRNPGLISRGYNADRQRKLFARLDEKSRSTSSPSLESPPPPPLAPTFERFVRFNDEARELALRFPTIPHFQAPNRVEAASALLTARPETDVLLLDDAFQHRRIERDLNIVLLDALNPFGGDRVFPAGFLREPTTGLKRADVVLLNRADLVPESTRETIRRRVERLAPNVFWAEIAQRPRFVYCPASFPALNETKTNSPNEKHPFYRTDYSTWRSTANTFRRFVAFCGLGAPDGFRRTLTERGLEIAAFETFPDHRAYEPNDFLKLAALSTATDADAFLTTVKDAVKLERWKISGKPIFALGIDVEFLTREEEFQTFLNKFCAKFFS